MKAIVALLLALTFTPHAEAGLSQACRDSIAAADYEAMCYSCHRLPVTKRECLEAGNFERAKACFLSLGDVISFHGPAVYRACYAAASDENVGACAALKYRSREYFACVQR